MMQRVSINEEMDVTMDSFLLLSKHVKKMYFLIVCFIILATNIYPQMVSLLLKIFSSIVRCYEDISLDNK